MFSFETFSLVIERHFRIRSTTATFLVEEVSEILKRPVPLGASAKYLDLSMGASSN